jgi:translation initiation factor IF-3
VEEYHLKKDKKTQGYRINDQIRAKIVRVIDWSGKPIGIISYAQAMEYAEGRGLDLIEINSTSSPPVCKIADHGKMMYEKSKREKANRKTKPLQVKTIQLKPNIGDNDLGRKISHIQKFLDKGHRVVVQVTMKGRQRAYPQKAEEIVYKIKDCLEESTLETSKRSGHGVTACFVKKKV